MEYTNGFHYMQSKEFGSLVWQRIRFFKQRDCLTWRTIAVRMDMTLPNLYKAMANNFCPSPQKIVALSILFHCSTEDIINTSKPLPKA